MRKFFSFIKKLFLEFFVGSAVGSIIALIICAVACCFINNGISKYFEEQLKNKRIEEIYKSEYNHRLESQYNVIRDSLCNEVDFYIKTIAPTSVIDPFLLVDLCDEYNVDIKFVLAQGCVESHFGTKGTASKTNSVFNVGAFDGHSAETQKKNGFGYNHPNESIEPYLILLTNSYLGENKTEIDLLENFVNHSGQRYASSENYEMMLKHRIKEIEEETEISELIDKYHMCKLKLGW